MEVFIISLLDAHHIRTKFINKANYHAVLKDSQINLSEAREHFFKNTKAHRAQKDISEALEQVLAHKRFK